MRGLQGTGSTDSTQSIHSAVKNKAAQLVIVSGVSGAGKATALDALEDVGYHGIDSIPAPLMGQFVQFLLGENSAPPIAADETEALPDANSGKYALLVDCRDRAGVGLIRQSITKLKDAGISVKLVFLDCQDDIVVQRYRETRRPHPLVKSGSLIKNILEAVAKERELLAGLRSVADRVIDTTGLSPHDLRRMIEEWCSHQREIEVSLVSFGFKYGVPHDIDLLVDVRFLPNPHFVPDLKPLTGESGAVSEYVFASGTADEFVERYVQLMAFLIPKYREEGKRYLTLAVGCTGGRHRSVAVSIRLQQELQKLGFPAQLHHRDASR